MSPSLEISLSSHSFVFQHHIQTAPGLYFFGDAGLFVVSSLFHSSAFMLGWQQSRGGLAPTELQRHHFPKLMFPQLLLCWFFPFAGRKLELLPGGGRMSDVQEQK